MVDLKVPTPNPSNGDVEINLISEPAVSTNDTREGNENESETPNKNNPPLVIDLWSDDSSVDVEFGNENEPSDDDIKNDLIRRAKRESAIDISKNGDGRVVYKLDKNCHVCHSKKTHCVHFGCSHATHIYCTYHLKNIGYDVEVRPGMNFKIGSCPICSCICKCAECKRRKNKGIGMLKEMCRSKGIAVEDCPFNVQSKLFARKTMFKQDKNRPDVGSSTSTTTDSSTELSNKRNKDNSKLQDKNSSRFGSLTTADLSDSNGLPSRNRKETETSNDEENDDLDSIDGEPLDEEYINSSTNPQTAVLEKTPTDHNVNSISFDNDIQLNNAEDNHLAEENDRTDRDIDSKCTNPSSIDEKSVISRSSLGFDENLQPSGSKNGDNKRVRDDDDDDVDDESVEHSSKCSRDNDNKKNRQNSDSDLENKGEETTNTYDSSAEASFGFAYFIRCHMELFFILMPNEKTSNVITRIKEAWEVHQERFGSSCGPNCECLGWEERNHILRFAVTSK